MEVEDRLRRLAAQYPSWGDGEAALRRVRGLARGITRDSAALVDSAATAAVTTTGDADASPSTHGLDWSDRALASAVRDHLNGGRGIGGFALPPGFEAVLPEEESPGAPGILVVGPDGQPLQSISVKLGRRVHFLHDALDRLGGHVDALAAESGAVNAETASFEDELVADADHLLEETLEELADDSAFDLGGVGLVQVARLSNRMAVNLLQGRSPTAGVDWSSEAFSFLVNRVTTGVGDVASLAVGPVGTAAGIGTRVAVRRARHRHGSALALEVATARVRAAVAD